MAFVVVPCALTVDDVAVDHRTEASDVFAKEETAVAEAVATSEIAAGIHHRRVFDGVVRMTLACSGAFVQGPYDAFAALAKHPGSADWGILRMQLAASCVTKDATRDLADLSPGPFQQLPVEIASAAAQRYQPYRPRSPLAKSAARALVSSNHPGISSDASEKR